MPSKHDPADALADILANADQIAGYVQGFDRDAFAASNLVRDAVERCLERVCEAAHRLGSQAAVLVPDQPWADIRGMGNWLRHAYDRIDQDLVWRTIQERLPGLAEGAREALDRLDNDQAGDPPSTS